MTITRPDENSKTIPDVSNNNTNDNCLSDNTTSNIPINENDVAVQNGTQRDVINGTCERDNQSEFVEATNTLQGDITSGLLCDELPRSTGKCLLKERITLITGV